MSENEFDKIKNTVEALCRDPYKREILRFFARHPYAHFDRQVLIQGLGLKDTQCIKTTLEGLVEQQLLVIRNEHISPLYWLTRCEPFHSAVVSIFSLRAQQAEGNGDNLYAMQLSMPLALCHI